MRAQRNPTSPIDCRRWELAKCQLLTAVLERGRNGEAERLARFAQGIAGAERVDCLLVGKVASGFVYTAGIPRHRARKHVARDRHWRIGGAVEPERVICPID